MPCLDPSTAWLSMLQLSAMRLTTSFITTSAPQLVVGLMLGLNRCPTVWTQTACRLILMTPDLRHSCQTWLSHM